jgi:hypothetical protein
LPANTDMAAVEPISGWRAAMAPMTAERILLNSGWTAICDDPGGNDTGLRPHISSPFYTFINVAL